MSRGKDPEAVDFDDLSDISDKDLAELQERLAGDRTKVRLQQNAVAAEVELRAAMKGMSAPAKESLRLRLSGSVAPKGETA